MLIASLVISEFLGFWQNLTQKIEYQPMLIAISQRPSPFFMLYQQLLAIFLKKNVQCYSIFNTQGQYWQLVIEALLSQQNLQEENDRGFNYVTWLRMVKFMEYSIQLILIFEFKLRDLIDLQKSYKQLLLVIFHVRESDI